MIHISPTNRYVGWARTAVAWGILGAAPLALFGAGGRMLDLAPSPANDFDPYAQPPKASAMAEPKSAVAETMTEEEARQKALAQIVVRSRSAELGRVSQNQESAGCRAEPSSPSIGADVPASYFGPPPATVNPSLVGPLQLLTSGPLDQDARLITIPLYRGEMARTGVSVWYILTDTTDEGNSKGLGLNFSAKLNFAATGRGARNATLMRNGLLVFDSGEVDFSPQRQVRAGGPGIRAFPPSVAEPGSVGDDFYSPLVKIRNAGGHIYNAPIIAMGVDAQELAMAGSAGAVDHSVVHDKVVAIDMEAETVTLALTAGFSFGRPVLYLSTDTSTPATAALEGATLAPGLGDIEVGNDDSAFSAVERIFVFSNGATDCDNPHRQGLAAAINDGETPFNVLGGIPTIATDYSPLWDVNLGEWTQNAIARGIRARLIDEFQILSFAEFGFLTGPGGAPYGSVGAIVNCPIVFRFL
ncbi:MAG: hypothetical protein KDC27_14610 [Acidobacteria bacterium]|nr:hypothetical protein [Acidobacteriota bacterium]